MRYFIKITITACVLIVFQLTVAGQSLQFSYTTASDNGPFSPNHVLAVWIEDSSRNFIKSLKVMGTEKNKYLYTWKEKSGNNSLNAISGATLSSHKPDNITWDFRDLNEDIVSDGSYELVVEFTDKNEQGPMVRIPFNKGKEDVHLKVADEEYFKDMVLEYSLLTRPDVIETIAVEEKMKYRGEMIIIPAGSFIMGNDKGSWEERPQHTVYLPTYQIGKYEVTRGEFRRFIEAGGYEDPQYWSPEGWVWKEGNVIVYAGMYGAVSFGSRPDSLGKRNAPDHWDAEQEWIGHDYGHPRFIQTDNHPVVGVTYFEAEAYCKWAGGRLPTEAEYEKAARWNGTHSYIYPYGDTWDPEKSNNPDDHNPAGGGYRVNQSAPVGSYSDGASPYGCMDMIGNAYEWCADWAKSYPGCSKEYDFTGKYHIVKGGCWDDVGVTCSFRSWYLPPSSGGVDHSDSDIIGFRMAK